MDGGFEILFGMSKMASLEGNRGESERLLERSTDTVNFIAHHCVTWEIRDSFLNASKVHKVLAGLLRCCAP